MKILGLGGSKGSLLDRVLRLLSNHQITLSSRSGACGPACDVTDPVQVAHLLETVKPDVVVFAAGVMPKAERLGEISDWAGLAELARIKIIGLLVLLDAAVRCGFTGRIILIGGAQTSEMADMVSFTSVNNAMFGCRRFSMQHTNLRVYYLELTRPVLETVVGEGYLASLPSTEAGAMRERCISPERIAGQIQDILAGHCESATWSRWD